MTYEAFLYLNNASVTLLERQQYQESMKTFEDAVRVHRCLSYSSQQQQQQQQQQTTSVDEVTPFSTIVSTNDNAMMIQETLQNASKRLANSTYCCNVHQSTTLERNNLIAMDPIIVLDIVNDDCFNTILRYGSSIDQIDFVIRISDYDSSSSNSDCNNNNRDWKLHYAILILNFGVTCKRSSEVITEYDNNDDENDDEYQYLSNDEYKNNLRDQSTQLFHIANQIVLEELTTNLSINKMNSICNNQDFLLTILYTMMISMFTVSHISDMMYWCHSPDEGRKCHIKFEKLYQFFELLINEYIKRCGGSINTTRHAAVA